jgi:hypothetical protein
MVRENETNKNSDKPQSGHDDGGSLGYLQGVCIAAIWVFIVLLLVAIFWPNLSERTKFFTGNFFNLPIAFAVIAQVLIYRKQWQVMERQWEEAKTQAEKATEQMGFMVLIECPYVGVFGLQIAPIRNNSLVVNGKFLNAGRTPAWDFKRKLRVELVEELPPPGWVINWDSTPDYDNWRHCPLAGERNKF